MAGMPAAAQEMQPQASTPQACFALESDAWRLACYDNVLGYQAPSTTDADLAANTAQQMLHTVRETTRPEDADIAQRVQTRRQVNEVFKQDETFRNALANAGRGSLLDSRWELAKDSKLGTFQLRAYKPIYLFPVFWTSDTNRTPQSPNPANTVTTPQVLDHSEVKFQLSFKTKVAENLFHDNGDLWVGYTQSSRWQAYNSEDSRPFRETNYEPEVMLAFRNNYSLGGWKGRMAGISLTHQSNGRSDPLSRSWNRVILNVGLDQENWALMLRPWYRLDESRRDDNNPDIEDYMGRGDATLVFNPSNGHEVSLMLRHSLRTGDRSHGAAQLDWGFPISNLLRGHLQVFHGYGESLIDYNHKATYMGVGISMLEWF
ncbi:MAG: phospholipase A [Xanthomonadaceae bacterium]|nr:phospholipase A [Xanthomonadaceae bacterium]